MSSNRAEDPVKRRVKEIIGKYNSDGDGSTKVATLVSNVLDATKAKEMESSNVSTRETVELHRNEQRTTCGMDKFLGLNQDHTPTLK